MKSKINNPKEEYEKELKNLNNKKERIRKAYIDEVFTENEFKEETKIIEKDLWKKFIEFLKDKFFSNNKYDDFINDLYDGVYLMIMI